MTLDIDRLLSELTLEEKASLTSGSAFWYTAPIDRLGIPKIMASTGRAVAPSWSPPTTAGLLVGVAPDTVLGQGIETAREWTGPRSIRGASGRPPAVNGRYRCPTLPHASDGFDRFSRSGGVNLGGRYWV
jgi:hypothetical protein